MNFSFFADKWPLLAEVGDLVEKNLYLDPNTSLIKLRIFGEILVKYLLAYENIKDPEDGKPISRLNILAAKGVIPDRLLPLFHSIRKNGNRAAHEAFGSVEVAGNHLHFAHRVACWFRQAYGEDRFTPLDYVLPPKKLCEIEKFRASNEVLQSRSAQLEARLGELQTTLAGIKAQEVTTDIKKARRKASKTFTNKMKLSEVETRQLIDEQLSATGWQADTQNLRYSKGTRPEKGVNIAIAEWPTLFRPRGMPGISKEKRGKSLSAVLGMNIRFPFYSPPMAAPTSSNWNRNQASSFSMVATPPITPGPSRLGTRRKGS
jgi:type I restriction enzyme R subunit